MSKEKNYKVQRVYVYRGQFAKAKTDKFRYIDKSYLIDAPAKLTESLKEDFIREMRKHPDSIGWELIGVSCVGQKTIKVLAPKEDKTPKTELLPLDKGVVAWVKVELKDGGTTWLPAVITEDGDVYTAFEHFKRNANDDDIRPFNSNPFSL